MLPGVIYNSKGQASSIQLDMHDFEMLLHSHTSENLIIDMEIDGGAPKKALLKEVQHDPVDGDVVHADFVEISMTKKMRVRILLRLVGEPVGVSQEGGVLEHLHRELEVECLPTDLVEEIDVDVSGLHIGDTILVRDLKIDTKFSVLAAPEVPVASVSAPRMEEEPVAVETTEGVEPEVIGETERAEAKAEKEKLEEVQEGKGQKGADKKSPEKKGGEKKGSDK